MRGGAFLLGVVLLGVVGTASAQGGRPWQDLSPEEKQRAWQNYQRYRQLPEDRQRSVERRYQQFQRMPPEERQRLRQNYQRYRELDRGQRQEFGQKYKRWKDKN